MIVIKNSSGFTTVILGTDQEKLIKDLLNWGLESRFSPLSEREQRLAEMIVNYLKG